MSKIISFNLNIYKLTSSNFFMIKSPYHLTLSTCIFQDSLYLTHPTEIFLNSLHPTNPTPNYQSSIHLTHPIPKSWVYLTERSTRNKRSSLRSQCCKIETFWSDFQILWKLWLGEKYVLKIVMKGHWFF